MIPDLYIINKDFNLLISYHLIKIQFIINRGENNYNIQVLK